MTRAVRLFVLASQVVAWALGTAGVCLCAQAPASASCCERVSRSGDDCCAPARDQLTAVSRRTLEPLAALEMPGPVAFIARAFTFGQAANTAAFAAPALPRPPLVLRI